KGLLWYNRNKDKMDTWDITKSLFEKEFDGKDGEIRAWTELQTLKYADFSEVSDFEIRLNKLLIKAKITDESVKLKILISAMKPKYQKLVIKSKAENIKKALELIQEEEDLEKIVNSKGISETKEDQFVQKKERTVVKTHKIEDSQDIVKTLIEGFDRLNINIIEKLGSLPMLNGGKRNYSAESTEQMKKGECFHCKEKGHRKFECPKLKQKEKMELGCIELGKNEETLEMGSLYALEKRAREESSANKTVQNKDKIQKTYLKETGENLGASSLVVPQVKVRRRKEIKLSETTDKYSIKDDLEKLLPNINMAQLLNVSPVVRKELVDLFKKIEAKEVNSIERERFSVTNCKALVEIFGSHYLTIMDTGAACSIITTGLLEELGLEADSNPSQIIVTADGTKHETTGKVSNVPLKIAGFIFPVDLLVMEKSANSLILGTDWLIYHKATLDLNKEELILPVDDLENILPWVKKLLSLKRKKKKSHKN
ncbi:hypothetical protein AYI69_g5110, partial [Smittium culicis]